MNSDGNFVNYEGCTNAQQFVLYPKVSSCFVLPGTVYYLRRAEIEPPATVKKTGVAPAHLRLRICKLPYCTVESSTVHLLVGDSEVRAPSLRLYRVWTVETLVPRVGTYCRY